MKTSIFLIAICCLVLLSGCADSESQERIAELESKLESIQSEFDNVKSTYGDVQSALGFLKNEVDDFAYEDWRVNVPEVEDATSRLELALNDLEIAISNVDLKL